MHTWYINVGTTWPLVCFWRGFFIQYLRHQTKAVRNSRAFKLSGDWWREVINSNIRIKAFPGKYYTGIGGDKSGVNKG